MNWRIGVDIGGTFTDVAVVNTSDNQINIVKTPTTPDDFSKCVVTAIETTLEKQCIDAKKVELFSHATTVVTNALLEENGASTALIATRGFRDLLELRRSARSHLYDLFQEPPAILIPRHRRFEINERISAEGTIVKPMSEEELGGIIKTIKDSGVESIAVCLLFSFINDKHEKKIGQILRSEFPLMPIFLSSEILPEVREFERTSTTAVCAYVGPILRSYLRRLEEEINKLGLPELHIMGSSGGVVDTSECLKMPAIAVESGPAAGVVAASYFGNLIDYPNLITFDMGGTTAKASLVKQGKFEITSEYEVGVTGNVNRWLHGTGHPIRVPVIDLTEVSAGGGSIAWIDPAGALKVGPKSSGAKPGPACYGKGGKEPTVTDCDLVLGYLNPNHLLGGELDIDIEAARNAIEEYLAYPLNQSIEEAAASVIAVVDHNMAEALRIVSVERGHDPRDFNLIAFGGAGPVHAASLATALNIPRVIIPPIPGGFSALGLVTTDLKRDYVRTFFNSLNDADPGEISQVFTEMENLGREMLKKAEIKQNQWEFRRSADLRYNRQAYELNIPVGESFMSKEDVGDLIQRFHEQHHNTYGHANIPEPVQIVNLRLSAIGRLGKIDVKPLNSSTQHARVAKCEKRTVWFDYSGKVDCNIFARSNFTQNLSIDGPAIIEATDTTVVVPPEWKIKVDPRGFLVMEVLGNV